uniref:Nucleoporin NDC1 n=1 Tax=Malurus cyaneus samueli TaxID=2593467 RepID=A0A8C5U7V9_9PASS
RRRAGSGHCSDRSVLGLRSPRVLGWRVAAAVTWSVLLLPICTAAFIILSGLDPFHPVRWISNSFSDLYTSYVIFCIFLMSVVIIVISIFNVEFYAVVPSIPCSRLALIGKIIHPQQVIHSFVHAVMGMLVAWCATVMTKGRFQFLAVSCTPPESLEVAVPQMCLNEYHLFFLLSGAFLGYSYSLFYLINNMNYLPFPIIQQYKYLRFRRSLPLLIKHSCVESLYFVRNFCVTYYFFGYIPKVWICTTMDLHTDSKLHPLDTLSGLLDLSLFYHTWLSGVFLLMTWYIAWLLFKIYATETHHFPVQPTFAQETDQCLPKILNSNPPLLIKFLALQDLMLLSQYSPVRRQEVFSLSQPGGHPHNWTAISRECLSLLSDLTQRLIAQQEAAAANGRAKQPVGEMKVPSQTPEDMSFQSPRSNIVLRGSMSPLVKPSLMPVKTSPGSDVGSPFSSPALSYKMGAVDAKSPWHRPVPIMRRGPKLWTLVSGRDSSTVLSLTAVSVVALSMESCIVRIKHPEASIQAVFSDAQMHIWALEGLSHLVAASFTEDQFGVVQTTLPAILNTLLTLQEVVDRHFKLPHVSSKPPRISGSLVDTSYKTLRFALRASLKTALYRITTVFGEHLNAVQVSTEHKKRLQQFLEYKE